ncbi:hypothetical protein [Zhongshania sp. BJYM1]|uniref:hypothetical protein n=1 Tax=Zhongshania aquatica TaxID=2965069 RepID=UPI0022B5CE5A|nr:hypothetical protein [Marortus sp. BJYM1]
MTADATTNLPKTLRPSKSGRLSSVLFFTTTFIILVWGWIQRQDQILSAESGFGYALGIIGVSGMLLLLSYPLAKRSAKLQKLMPIRHWFRIHMMLGVLGPLAIAFHSNFRFGSLNSRVALSCMILVVISGFVGRYIYTKIHIGLYGQRANGQMLAVQANRERQQLLSQFEPFPELIDIVNRLYNSLLPSELEKLTTVDAVLAGSRRRRLQRFLRRAAKRQNDPAAFALWRDSKTTLKAYTETLGRLAQLRFFERLFSWWHVLHLPFFVMMLLTATLHVWAVHYY